LFIRFAGASYGRSVNVCSGTVDDRLEGLYGERFKRGNIRSRQQDTSSPVRKSVTYESDVSDGVQVTVLF